MINIFKKSSIFIFLIVALLLPGVSFAHGMDLILEESGVLRVEYEGGGFSPRTEITIYDENGNELAKGPVDEDGKFHFDENLNIHKAVADDGMGHRAEYQEGATEKNISKLPVIIGVFAVAGIFVYVFSNKNKKNN
ncbi:hypothetical protein J2Z35_001349 [Acetoanaerobium pronyense]|uniref:Nickel transport protein n=1 Tax=Acetoanaerobium pronyense TaxID=1482736 RepID=A0ABS4KIE0_9FIRM|nr:hypothetical protein [Acetoanaerobium pronyense]MBP2027552.1 hypothetical protein [Acetoanaerobium pronyense]